MRFQIVVPAGAVEPWISKCISSVLGQTYTNWRMAVILDPQGDNSYEKAVEASRGDPRIRVIKNDECKLALHNIVDGAKLLSEGDTDEDVLVLLDGDDWLTDSNSLEIVKKYYDHGNTLLTHGDYKTSDNSPKATLSPYNIGDNVRSAQWKATHLRTMKMKVWNKIKEEDLKNDKGVFFESAWDLAIMMPAIEIAGLFNIRYVSEPVYTYNTENPVSDFRKRPDEQGMYEKLIRNRPPYQKVEF